jgi:hypothetical protein
MCRDERAEPLGKNAPTGFPGVKFHPGTGHRGFYAARAVG